MVQIIDGETTLEDIANTKSGTYKDKPYDDGTDLDN